MYGQAASKQGATVSSSADGQVTGLLAEGLTSPKSTLARALPVEAPPRKIATTASASLRQFVSTGPGAIMATTTLGAAAALPADEEGEEGDEDDEVVPLARAAADAIKASWSSSRLSRSLPSVVVAPPHSSTTSAPAMASTAAAKSSLKLSTIANDPPSVPAVIAAREETPCATVTTLAGITRPLPPTT